MAQELIQTQKQEQKLQQRLSAQQMLQVRLLEMPLTELEESINVELDDNPALETMSIDDAMSDERAPMPAGSNDCNCFKIFSISSSLTSI